MLATGFWYLGEWVHSPTDIRQDEADRFDAVIDTSRHPHGTLWRNHVGGLTGTNRHDTFAGKDKLGATVTVER